MTIADATAILRRHGWTVSAIGRDYLLTHRGGSAREDQSAADVIALAESYGGAR